MNFPTIRIEHFCANVRSSSCFLTFAGLFSHCCCSIWCIKIEIDGNRSTLFKIQFPTDRQSANNQINIYKAICAYHCAYYYNFQKPIAQKRTLRYLLYNTIHRISEFNFHGFVIHTICEWSSEQINTNKSMNDSIVSFKSLQFSFKQLREKCPEHMLANFTPRSKLVFDW